MKIVVRGHNLKVTKAIKEYAEKKLQKLESFYSGILEVVVELEVKQIKDRTKAHEARANVKLPMHVNVHSEAKTADIYASLDKLVDVLETPLKKYHDKMKNNHRKMSFFSRARRKVTRNYADFIPNIKISYEQKKAGYKIMDPIEAVLQLAKSQNSFFVFNNSKTGHQIGIVYDRKNGTYGLQTFKKLYLKRAKLKKFKDLPADVTYDGDGVKITKIKDISVKAYSAEEAAGRLANSLDRTFMSFMNTDTEKISVIYKKKEPLSFGLIEPVL
jgi:putative sigma-54 modulation protein